jgi:hypothetical protein
MHLEQFLPILPKLESKDIVLTHVTRRTGVARARRVLRKRIGDEAMKRIHFLMDLDDAREEGDIEDAGPHPTDTAE